MTAPWPEPRAAVASLLHEVLLLDADAIQGRIPLAAGASPAEGIVLEGAAHGFRARIELEAGPTVEDGWHGVLQVTRDADAPAVGLGLRIPVTPDPEERQAPDEPAVEPSWLIPGCFYGENRSAACTRLYPRYASRGGSRDELTSDWWAFSADRATTPMVFGWDGGRGVALGVDPSDPDEPAPAALPGLGFAGPSARGPGIPSPGRSSVWVDLPARSEPVAYDGFEQAIDPVTPTLAWEPGGTMTLPVRLVLLGPDRHGYAPVIRAAAARTRATHPTRPWLDAGATADLAAHGLLVWHHRSPPDLLVEVATFDRDLRGRPLVGDDRVDMHVAWLSGTPAAGALLAYGRRMGHTPSVVAALGVLDHVCTGLSPSGLLWGYWRADRGWSGGWTPDRDWVHVRTIGEAVLFLVRTLVADRALGVDHPEWESVIRSNLDEIVRLQGPDGGFGTYVDATRGVVTEREGSGGLVWVPALLEAAAALGGEAAATWRDSAIVAGEAYAAQVEREWLHGAPEDIHLAPSSEDGYGAILAYVSLLEHDDDPDRLDRWRDLALRAAEWTLTFRFTYDLAFPAHTMLEAHRFATRGADVASPANLHLHAYGLVCVPELLRLADRLDDDHLRRSALDHVACFRQFIARADGDFGARRGMTTERFYHTDAFGPKGALLPLSHAWCLGLVLRAALDELEREARA